MKRIINYLSFLVVTVCNAQNFHTDGNGIRNVISAKSNNQSILYVSEIDGAISAYTTNGHKLWRNPSTNPSVLFEIVAADVDNDGNEDVLAVSGSGSLYCYKSDGELLWEFKPAVKVRLSEIAVIGKGENMRIFTGGNNYKLYEIDVRGKQISETKIKGVVRKLESGRFTDVNKACLFLFTLKHDKSGSEFFGFIDANTKQVIKSKGINQVLKGYKGIMVHDVSVADINKDQKDEVLIFGTIKGGSFAAIDGDLNKIAGYIGGRKESQRYAHTMGTCLLPFKDEIVFQMGGFLYVTDLKGNLISKTGERHRGIIFNDFAFDNDSKKLIGGGQIGGGNGLYVYNTRKKNWWNTKHELIGRMKNVDENLNQLYQQALDFEIPSYQKQSNKEFVMITNISENGQVKKVKNQALKIVKQYIYAESTDRSHMVQKMGEIALKRDKRKKYNLSRQQIIALAKKNEINNQPFALWAGHGSDPFITQIETLEEIIRVAPNTCYGFVYAEMANTKDPRVIHFVREYVPRLSKVIRENKSKAKLYFRYKGMFWAADSHAKLWQELFFSNKYNDILIPSAEDTNNRLQDLNFSGRVGMFSSGYVNDYAMRLVDDNPTSWRPLSPGGQRSVSPYLRNAAIMSAYGSRYGLLFNIGYLEDPGMNIFYALLKSGLIPVVEKEDIASIGSWHLIKDVDEEYLHHVNQGHNLCTYTSHDEDAVVSVASVNWCGTSIPAHDYSKVSMGVDYRWLNFMPTMPSGMVPVTHFNYKNELEKRETPYCISDIHHGYVDGEKVKGKEFYSTMNASVKKGGNKLPVIVEGASWCAIKLDEKHIRLVLVDPGYIDPQDRDITVNLNGTLPIKATNILNKQSLNISNSKIQIKVPAGSMSFIDLEYE